MKNLSLFIFLLIALSFSISSCKVKNELVEKQPTISDVPTQAPSKVMLHDLYPEISELSGKASQLLITGKEEDAMNFYFDSIPDLMEGAYFESLDLQTYANESITIGKNNKPTFIELTATWCRPCNQIKPALKTLAKEYKGQIDFVQIYWDTKEELDDMDFEPIENIKVVSALNRDPSSHIVFGNFKHELGFPFVYYLNGNNKIVTAGIADTGLTKDMEEALVYKTSYKSLKFQLEKLLMKSR